MTSVSPPFAANLSRVALVTGASRGIGRSIAEVLTSTGITVLTPARSELDLSCPSSVREWLSTAPENIDILVNNAGVNPIGLLEDVNVDAWEHSLAVNLTAPMLLIQHCSRAMRRGRWGRIVNVSSCYSIATRPGRGPYGAAKAGLNSLTRSAALEFARDGILVNAVCPGFVETDLTRSNNTPSQIDALAAQVPIGRLAQGVEVARLISFLVSEQNTYMTGQTIILDGGFLLQ